MVANTQFDGGQVKVKGVEIGPNTPKYVGLPRTIISQGITKGYIRIDSSTNESGAFTVQIRAVSMKAVETHLDLNCLILILSHYIWLHV